MSDLVYFEYETIRKFDFHLWLINTKAPAFLPQVSPPSNVPRIVEHLLRRIPLSALNAGTFVKI
jgi:hypothetical protein